MGESERTLQDILRTLTAPQLSYVSERMFAHSDSEAAKLAGLKVQTVYHWPNKAEINEAVRLARLDFALLALEKLRRLGPRAVDVLEYALGKRQEMDACMKAAQDILDRLLGKAVQRGEFTGADGEPLFDMKMLVMALRQADEALSDES